ncbi:MAG: type II toxin-antitoxin system VapC family toxin [Afipia sp.]|nr:type II toxin-antitoxin system VapC family toxin [Afipia sp.]
MNTPLLLDTCAAIWIAEDQPIAQAADDLMARAIGAGQAVYVSPITGWELGLLVSRGRMNLLMSPQRWFERLLQAPGIRLAELSPDVLIASSFLPGTPPRDPADRIFAATAREYGYQIVTRDRLLLSYAELGHIEAVAC